LNPYGTLAVVWVSVGACIIAGLYFTHNPNCLWALMIPAFIGVKGH